MRQEKAKMKRIGGFLLEILIIVFVFSYSNSGPENAPEEKSASKQEVPASQILLATLSIPTSANGNLTQWIAHNIEFVHINIHLIQERLSYAQPGFSSRLGINLYYSNTTINAP